MNWFQIAWVSGLTGCVGVLVFLVGNLSGEVSFLKRKLSLHEDMIVRLANEVTMCTDYLNDNCMFCMHNIEPVREEENKE